VVGVDVSRAMLDAAAAKNPPGNVELVQAGFLTYRHRGGPPGFAYSRNALHHLPDLWKVTAFQRVASMLAPGGLFLLRDFFFSFEPGEERDAIGTWLERAPADPAAGWTRPELETHLQEEHSTFTWLLEPMIERAGLQIVSAEYSPSKIYASYVLSSGA
jgi:SAM-dependent methyltransferase